MRTLSETHFVAAASPARLEDDEIHLWIFPQSDDEPGAKTDTPRRLRETLAAYLGIGTDELRIERNAAGKPYLLDQALQFNLSHSGGTLLIGLSRTQPLGVDIEGGARARPYLEIAQRYFTGDEAAALATLPTDALRSRFLELWSAKEAVLKAIGRGIAFGLNRVGFALDASGATRQLVHLAAEAGTPAQWQLVRLAPQAGFTGAVAWRGPQMRLRAFVAANVRAAATIGASAAS
jgi:4'-phosphopantetheinyl transferase